MNHYQLIAFDMDGTLLNDLKEVTPGTVDAIARASAAGKTVILNTGRGPAELREFKALLPSVRYYNCISGALIYDAGENCALASRLLDTGLIQTLLKISAGEDIMPQMINDQHLLMNGEDLLHLDRYQMLHFQKNYERNVTPRKDLVREFTEKPFPVYKLNLYHTDPEARERTYKRILDARLPVQLAFAERTSLEISPLGVHKGIGLTMLCNYLGLSIDQTIVVGDADNDLTALETGGLAIAMGNANDHVRAVSDYIVADNNHDGCAEAIDRYLLELDK